MHLVPHVVPRRSVGSSRMLLLAVNFALALATASACDSGTTDDGTGTGTAAQGSSLSLMSNGKVIATSWAIPLNAPNNKLALFSEQREPFTVNNMTGKTVTVKAVTLTPVADGGPPGAAAEEWSLQKYDSKILPIDAAGATIATGKSYDFYVRFYPVVGLQRKATLKIETDGGNFEIALSGSGAPDSTWPVGTVTQAPWALGTADKDELTGTMVAADASSHYISANVDFSTNEGVLITKVSNGGTVA